MTRLTAAFLFALGALCLSGCGIRGDLERPPPLWGEDQRTPAERAHETGETPEAAPEEAAADDSGDGPRERLPD